MPLFQNKIMDEEQVAAVEQKSNRPSARAYFGTAASSYRARFAPSDDPSTVTQGERDKRNKTYAEGANQYYEITTVAYLSGWGEHFHFTPFAPNEPIKQALAFYEHRLAHEMGLQRGMKVLDLGCGVGGPAREIAKLVGCEIIGISLSQYHIDKAIEMTAKEGLSHLCTFVKGDFCHLPFPNASFDAAYGIEATCHAPSLLQVYSEVSRVLKPGATIGISEWVMKPPYDPSDSKHLAIRNRIERGCGVSHMDTVESARKALLKSGFDIRIDEDYSTYWNKNLHFFTASGSPTPRSSWSPVTYPSRDGRQTLTAPPPCHPIMSPALRPIPDVKKNPAAGVRPWYYPLVGQTGSSSSHADWWIIFKMSPFIRTVWYWFNWILVKLGILPQGLIEAMDTMAECVDSCVAGGKEGIFSPCWWFIGEKVGEPTHWDFELGKSKADILKESEMKIQSQGKQSSSD